VLFFCCERCDVPIPVEQIQALCRSGDEVIEFEALQVLRVAAARNHALFLNLADFFIRLTDGCAYRVRFQCVWAVCAFLFRVDLVLADRATIGNLLRFVVEQADGEPDLACVVAWALRGLRLKFALAGRAEELAEIWADCDIAGFLARCDDLGNQTLNAEIARIDVVVSEEFQALLLGMQQQIAVAD
jgi:hypothetical protein